jgi:hypothetical protein
MSGKNIMPKLSGDGHEYLIMNQAFANHFTPDVRPSDLETTINVVSKEKETEKFIVLLRHIQQIIGDETLHPRHQVGGFFKSFHGRFYGYHFWFYSAVCAPVTWILRLFHGNELRAFQITNTLIFLLVIYYIFFRSGLDNYRKLFAGLLFTSTGILYYLLWTHPEVYSASLFFLALLALNDKKYTLAMLCTALASFQNLPIIFAIPLIAGKFILDNGFKIKSLLILAVPAMFSLFPILFYYWNFKVPNLILTTNLVSVKYLSLKRFSSLFFDLNQGIIVAMPFALAAFIYIFIQDCIVAKRRSFYLIYLVLIIVMAVPSIQQKNWNMGASVIVRYGLWISMPMLIYMIERFDLRKLSYKIFALVIILGQLYVVNKTGWVLPKHSNYLQFNKFSSWVLSKHPALYNPDPEIFAERIKHREDVLPEETPIVYYDKENKPTKILIHKDYIGNYLNSGLPGSRTFGKTTKIKYCRGWGYINL